MLSDATYMALLRLLPKSALSRVVGALTRSGAPRSVHQAAIRWFIRNYRVNVAEMEGVPADYATFSDFFSRPLLEGARPVAREPKSVASPVDGRVSEAGVLEGGLAVQAKGIKFSLDKLLGDATYAKAFDGGAYATLYLAPRDYHRFHAPLAGAILGYTYLPGALWPVNAASARSIDALYAINERFVIRLRCADLEVALVAVGATCVGRIRATFDDVLTHHGMARDERHYAAPIPVAKGDELGAFEMGSTVILLCQAGGLRWDASLIPGSMVRFGQRIGSLS